MNVVTCPIAREVDVYMAIGRGRDIAAAVGFDEIDRTRIEIVILELTRNILVHAVSGELQLESIQAADHPGLAVTARDSGPGIADIALAMRDGFSTAQTLGAGLPGVRRLMDEFTIESRVGAGTTVRAVKWLKGRRPAGFGGGRQP